MTVRAAELAALASAIAAVARFEAPADAVLSSFFRAHPKLGARDRAFVAEGTFAFLRRMRSLAAQAGTQDPKRLAIAVASRELGISARELAPALDADSRAWLTQFRARGDIALPPAVAFDLPDWLWDRLGEAFGEVEREALARAWQSPAPFDLRVNPLRTTRDDALARLRDEGLDVAATPYSPLGVRVRGRPSLLRHPMIADGSVEVQDEGSQLVSYLVAPRRNDMVVDFCAGAGGKTLHLGALMRSQGRLYAFDVVQKRLRNLGPRLARSGLSNVHPQLIAHERDAKVKRLAGKIDRVLVDAPCTGFGTLRRNPDLKWRQTPAALAELVEKQRRILASAATLVKPGGRLVYATCSVLPEENDGTVDALLAIDSSFHRLVAQTELARANIPLATGPSLRVFPHRHDCDGFFAAVLERRA
jgi:16S rRNA (cytosine967-C5)-methyltransferase